MKTVIELLPGAFALRLKRHDDERGSFVKSYAASALAALGLPFVVREQFVTTSSKDVIRGMHFQVPPDDHVKLVLCLSGKVQDVVTDLREGPGFGRTTSIELQGGEPLLLYLPQGVAHGFRARTDGAIMLYMTSTEHAPASDRGLLWSSIDHDWGCAVPLLSSRDSAHPPLATFVTPFRPSPPCPQFPSLGE